LLKALVAHPHRLLLSNEMLAEVTKVLRYEKFQALYDFTEGELYEYVQFLRIVSDSVILDPYYRAPLRDLSDLIVLQTAERGAADILCTSDRDFP
jgi:putative PIN family toxin of toxin-antitoxin system